MIKHPKKKIALIFAAVLALSFAVPAAAQAEAAGPSTFTTTTDAPEISSDPEARYVSVAEAQAEFGYDPTESTEPEPELSANRSWWGCDYEGRANYTHVTNNEASVHGYWVQLGGTCPKTATVTVDLQALFCDMDGDCSWITQKTNSGTFTSGGGSGNWATPHKTCGGANLVAWRGQVDVDLTDFADPYGYDYGVARDLNCYPA
jgi:hypothetical protein